MLLIIQSLPHPKTDLTNLMTSLTFLFYWQWCSERSCLLRGFCQVLYLCALLNYLREKITVSLIKWEYMLKTHSLCHIGRRATSEPNVSWKSGLLTFVISLKQEFTVVPGIDFNFPFNTTENTVMALGLGLQSVAFYEHGVT